MSKNRKMNDAKSAKNDEFYTQLTDIEKEIKHYREHFKDKVVFCNCDDPKWSNFWYYFDSNFEKLNLKKLISTHYDPQKEVSYKLATYIGESGMKITTEDPICGDGKYPPGDFRSKDCIELLEEADIVVTNPPFSLFGEYVSLLTKYNKKFLILGNQNAITYKEIFPLLKNNELWLGFGSNMAMEFRMPDSYNVDGKRSYINDSGEKIGCVSGITWFTNLDTRKRHENLIMYKTYNGNEKDYPKFDNYNAINVALVKDIPLDYYGVMGVPITFLSKYNPAQFEIIGATESEGKGFSCGLWDKSSGVAQPLINGERKYKRLFVKRRTSV